MVVTLINAGSINNWDQQLWTQYCTVGVYNVYNVYILYMWITQVLASPHNFTSSQLAAPWTALQLLAGTRWTHKTQILFYVSFEVLRLESFLDKVLSTHTLFYNGPHTF